MGLAIFYVVPKTLGVGVAITHAAHGNLALSLLLTVATNMLGCITAPFLLYLLLAGGGGVVDINPGPLAHKLVLTVLIPTVQGRAIRAFHQKSVIGSPDTRPVCPYSPPSISCDHLANPQRRARCHPKTISHRSGAR